MDETKKTGGAPQPEGANSAPAQPEGTPDTAKADGAQALRDELEDLARVFQEELDRAKEQAAKAQEEEAGMLIQSLDDLPDRPQAPDEEADAAEEKPLCACCGEHPAGTKKDPDSPYCPACDEGLRHYPFDFLNILLALVLAAFVFYGGYRFADHTEVFTKAAQADRHAQQNELFSAADAYMEAQTALDDSRIGGELVAKRAILTTYKLGYMSNVLDFAENLRSWELQLPHLRAAKTAIDRAEQFLVSGDAAMEILSPYMSAAAADIPYDDVFAQLEALKTAEPAAPEALENGYVPQFTGYNAGMITFYEYYLALISNQPLETQLALVEQIRELEPEETWIYATLLGELYAKTGRDVEPICTLMQETNAEDDTPALLRVIALRTAGRYDEAVAAAEDAIAAENEYASELYRQIGICYLLQGDYAKAYEQVNEGFQSTNPSVQLVNTLALCAAAAGETDAYNEAVEMLEGSGYAVSADVTDYRAGAVTLESIFTEGDLDVT